MNKYTKLFEEFLDLIEFTPVKHKCCDDAFCWSLIDRQGANLGDIMSFKFENAAGIIDNLDIYINDYIVRAIEEYLEDDGIGLPEHYICWEDLLEKRHLVGRDIEWDFDVLDMIVSHADEINLEECYYEMED